MWHGMLPVADQKLNSETATWVKLRIKIIVFLVGPLIKWKMIEVAFGTNHHENQQKVKQMILHIVIFTSPLLKMHATLQLDHWQHLNMTLIKHKSYIWPKD